MKLKDYLSGITAVEHFRPIAAKGFLKKYQKLVDAINNAICEEKGLTNIESIQNLSKDTLFTSVSVITIYEEFNALLKSSADNLISQD